MSNRPRWDADMPAKEREQCIERKIAIGVQCLQLARERGDDLGWRALMRGTSDELLKRYGDDSGCSPWLADKARRQFDTLLSANLNTLEQAPVEGARPQTSEARYPLAPPSGTVLMPLAWVCAACSIVCVFCSISLWRRWEGVRS